MADFKIAIFGNAIWIIGKDPEGAHILSFYLMESKLCLFHSTGSSFRDTGRLSKLPYLAMELSPMPKVLEATHVLFFLA